MCQIERNTRTHLEWKKHFLRVRQLMNQVYKDPKAARTLLDWVGENVMGQISEDF